MILGGNPPFPRVLYETMDANLYSGRSRKGRLFMCCQILLVCTVLPVHMCKCKMGPDLQITKGFGTWHLQIWAEMVAKLHESTCNVWELASLWSPISVGHTHMYRHTLLSLFPPHSELRFHSPGGQWDCPQSYRSPSMMRRVSGI